MKATALTLIASLAASPSLADSGNEAVDALIASMQAGDTAAIEAAFTQDAGYAYSVDGTLNRGASFDGWLVSDITGPGSVFVVEAVRAQDGTTVDLDVIWGRGGNPSTEARYIFTVENGLIDSWHMTGR